MKILKRVLLLLGFGFVGFGLYRSVLHSDFTRLQDIVVEGADKATEDRIRHTVTVKPGDAFWNYPVEKEAAAVKRDPWVEGVEVRRQFPHTLVISVQERKPVAVMGSGRGDFKFVDGSNVVIDKAEPQQVGGYPILLGGEFATDKDLRSQAIELLKSLPDEGQLSKHDVSDVQFNQEHGFQLTLTRSQIVVDIGKENIPLHVDRARRVVEYLDQHGINASHIDSDYVKKVLVKVRKTR